MHVFILCTGRSGSSAIINACKHITNYTSGHESLTMVFGKDRLVFPDNHIEADNRLGWHLGQLNKIYGNNAFYVHMLRDKDKVSFSYLQRFYQPTSIVDAFCGGIKKTPPELLNEKARLNACYEYIDTVNANIEMFLSDKTNTMTIHLENILNDFPLFWKKIGAEGNLENALKEFEIKHNATPKKRKLNRLHRLKLLAIREWRHISMYIKS